MSCLVKFPAPKLFCVLQLLASLRGRKGLQETLLLALILIGGVIEGAKTLDEDLEVDDKQIEELEAELLAALEIESLLSADLDNLDLPESEDKELDPQVWEILLPILINFAIELIREWIKSRRSRR
jgi:hypothetical protein